MLGIILGAYSCNYLYMHRMHWIYEKPATSPAPCTNKLVTFARKFKPNVWTKYDWSVFASLTRYNQSLFYCFVCLGIDCMNFFLKYILWVPANHNLLLGRLCVWAVTCIASSKEYYEYVSNPHCKRVGPFVWIMCFTLGVEFSIAIKFGAQMFTQPFPWYVQALWTAIFSLVGLGAVYAYCNGRKLETQKEFDLQEPTIDVEPSKKDD